MKPETQQRIIGSIALHGQKAMTLCIRGGMTAEWFSDEPKALFVAANELFSTGKPIDTYTLPEKVSGVPNALALISRWSDEAPVVSHLDYYIDLAKGERKLTLARHQADVTNNKIATATTEDISDILAETQFAWSRIGMENSLTKPFGEIATDLVTEWQQPKTEQEANAILWPLEQLNRLIGQVEDDYIILAARPSVGKTAAIVQMATMLGLRSIRSATASLESSARRLAMRAISYLGEVNTIGLRRKDYTEADMKRAIKASERLKTLPIAVADNGMTIDQIRAYGTAEKAAGARILFIDNAKHIRTAKNYDNPVHKFMEISQRCKEIRDDLRIPVVLLHHLSREMKLAWSDDLEKDADIIINMTNNQDYSEEPCGVNQYKGKFIVDWEIIKNREGPPGMTVMSRFEKNTQRFSDYSATVNYDVDEM